MSEKRSPAPLILGAALILIGSLFLVANVYRFDIEWLMWMKFVLPALLVLLGVLKLVRHFTWEETRLARHPGRAGLLGGLFLLALGLLWILDLANAVNGFKFFGLYWPLILVLLGLGKMTDYYRFSGRLRFRTVEVLGVFFLVACGLLSSFVADTHFPLLELPIVLGDDLPLGKIMGKRYEWTAVESVPAKDLRELEVSNLYGDVRIRPGETDSVEVRLTKEVFESSEERAREAANLVQLSVAVDGPAVRIGTNREDLKLEKSRFKSHLNIRIPERLSVRVSNGYGDVRVAEIDGPLEVTNSYGDVIAENIEGQTAINNRHDRVVVRGIRSNLTVQNYRGSIQVEEIAGGADLKSEYDVITARKVQGDVSVVNRFGTIRVQEVQGSAKIEGPGSQINVSGVKGRVAVQHSHKNLTVTNVTDGLEAESSYSQIRISNIRGVVNLKANHASIDGTDLGAATSVQAKSSQVSLTRIAGPFEVATSLRDISIQEFKGTGQIMNDYGEVFLSPSGHLQGDLTVSSKNGQITLRLLPDSAFRLSAQALGGSVHSEFGDTVEAEKPGEDTPVIEQLIGTGGPKVRLQTTHAEIRVLRK